MARSQEAAETEAPTPVTVEPAVRGAIDHVITADAVLYPINQANVIPKLSAPVRRILVNRGRPRSGRANCSRNSKTADLAAAAEETKHQYEQTQAASQTLTGATVAEDRAKAESDVKSAQQALDTAKKLYDNRVALQREGALAQKLVDDAKVALVQAQSQFDAAQRHLQGLNQVSQREAIRGSRGTGGRREGALRQRHRCRPLTGKFAAPSMA